MIAPISICCDSIYDESALKFCLGITPAALAEGRRSGTLRFSRIGNRVFYRGDWLLTWLESASNRNRKVVAQ